ncbi:Hypothetical protein, putative [Bodo saltans]|uniref:Up-regulated during septation protein 1 domain-containing protein n=1 Tax=Bodo saltans TaxID=75058 RepID=A0A0S4JTI4_BODSA|nr:Hypothetical protein, putative [Bodo saltans]|eukprot:CUG92440.1 Hypothetical protein, putative [Bodo saltans]
MLLYIAAIEQQVLLPATTSISSLVAQNLASARNDVDKRLEIVGSLASVDAPASFKRALALSEPPAAIAAQAVLKRHEILAGASPLHLEDSFVVLSTMMSNTNFLRSLVNEFTSKLTTSEKWGSDERSAATALATQRRSKELLEEIVMMQQDGQVQLKLLERVKELEKIVDAHEAERQEVAHRFQVLQRAIESAKNVEYHREQESSLTEELALLKLQRQHQAETIQSQQDELLTLGKELRDVKREHEDQVARLKQQLSDTVTLQSASDVDAFIHKVDAGPPRSAGPDVSKTEVQAYQTKLRAFEMTTAALNNELVNLEDKIVALERKSDDEAAENSRQVGELRRRHKSELDECHDIVSKLTTELDTLLKENTALKQRIKKLPK